MRFAGMMLPGNGSRTNPVPFGLGLVVSRVEDLHRQRAEVSVAHGHGRNRHQPRLGLPPIAVAVVGHEEEHAVAPNRAAGGGPVLMLIVVGLEGGEERLRVERLVAEEFEGTPAQRVRPRLDDVVRGALAVVHHGRSARFDLELLDGFDRDPVGEVAPLSLHHRVGDRHALDVGVVGEVLASHHVAPAAHRLHARHEEHEGRRVARTARIHHERKRGVDVVSNGLAQARVRRSQRG